MSATAARAGQLSPGDPAPDFTLPDADGEPVSLAAYRGRRVVLYFYPAAATPGCTTEACDFRDNLRDFSAAGLDVVGISPDDSGKLRAFRDAQALTFPLLSDTEKQVLAAYGAWGEKSLYGRTVTGVIRSTVVVDARGEVEAAWYDVRAKGHVDKLRRELGL